MEGVGARLGRSSTRYGPTTTFTGPVRKWKKTWVPLSAPQAPSSAAGAGSNASSTVARSNLLLYKWAPLGAEEKEAGPKRKKHKYVPIYVEEKQETDVKSDDENNKDGDDKPNTDDMSMEENQVSDKAESGGNGTDLNLNLGLNDGDE